MPMYRVITKGPQSESFIVASSAKEASDAAATALQTHEEVTVEDPDGHVISLEALVAIIRDQPVETK